VTPKSKNNRKILIIKIIKKTDSADFAASMTTTLATAKEGEQRMDMGGNMKNCSIPPNEKKNEFEEGGSPTVTPRGTPTGTPTSSPAANPAGSPSSPRLLTPIPLSLEGQLDASNPMENDSDQESDQEIEESDQEGPTAPAAPSERDSDSDDITSYLNTG